MKPKPALWGHDWEPSGEIKHYSSGEELEACRWCGWPEDEHPNHPSRKDNRHIFSVDRFTRTQTWSWLK